ncbi:MAG: TetR/AcrR family transcriptional regulator [Gemmataceae bacterium]|nr:TetR/AcrR family transcriptional regulator [Gemmataceae bacterium]
MRKPSRVDIASLRREQIIDAAVAVIAEEGLPNLSLSAIEQRAGMARGHLTYYFPTKEAILLAVFDRVLHLMCRSVAGTAEPDSPPAWQGSGWDLVRHLLTTLVQGPPVSPEFHCLQYTFLAQIGYREDFRQRLATLYEEWRAHLAQALADDQDQGRVKRPVSPRALATLIQALLHGLTMQAAADPSAFDRGEMVHLCLDLLGNYLGVAVPAPANGSPAPARPTVPPAKGQPRRGNP